MKNRVLFALFGVLTILAIWFGPELDEYALRPLPSEWTGPRYRHWVNGVEVLS